jgi:hypothetical protein
VTDEQPPLTLDAVRAWVGDFEIGKGRPYAEDAAFGCRREDGRGDLVAYVRGTRVRPYTVHVTVGARWNNTANGKVLHAVCNCPVGAEGKCKHVAAVLLAYLEDPARFPEITRAEATFGEQSRDELLVLVQHLFNFAPDLRRLLAVPMPGFVSGEVSPDLFRGLAVDVIRAARPHDERAEEDVVEGLWPLVWLGANYQVRGEGQAAEAVTEGLTLALRQAGLNRERLQDALNAMHHAGFWAEVKRRLGLDESAARQPPPF